MSPRVIAVAVLLGVTALVASNAVFIVSATQRAVMLRFGEMVRADIPPGLHFKVPMMHQVRKFDARLLTVDSRPERFLTQEKKFLSVDSYAKWRIADVGKFYTATNGEERRAQELLAQRINNGLRNQFGERTLHEVVSGERDQLMTELTQRLDQVTRLDLGIEVLDVRVKRIDLPTDVSDSVYDRMRAEREREAREHRSKGKELAEGIRAEADRERTVLTANAYRTAEEVRGAGDAEAASVYAAAYQQDPEFYTFTRSLSAYREAFGKRSDLLLIEPNSDFFRYLKNARGPAAPR